MRNKNKWIISGIILMAIFVMTMMKTPEEITEMLTAVTSDLTLFSALVHILFLVVAAAGLLFKKIRNIKPRSLMLEFFTAFITLYFGFFGVFRLGAYVDVILIVCALFLIIRLSSSFTYKGLFEKEGA